MEDFFNRFKKKSRFKKLKRQKESDTNEYNGFDI